MSSSYNVIPVRESAKCITESSKDVKINSEGVKTLSEKLVEMIKKNSAIWTWREHMLNPKTADKAAIDWVFMVDTLNFSFWSEDETKKYTVDYGGAKHTGYWSLCAAVNRAQDEGIPITDPAFYATVSQEQLTHIFRSDSPYPMPMPEERVKNLHEAGKVLVEKYDGSFINCLKKCEGSAQKLLELVLAEFPSYRDEADFAGRRVSFYKRAQILIGDIWSCWHGEGLGKFHDISMITMFADYRIPQALVHFGVLEYTDSLMKFLKTDKLMVTGDVWEVEIRGCSIWAVELVCEEMKKLVAADPGLSQVQVNSILIDQYLWDYRRAHDRETKHIPIHKIRCIYY